MTDIIVVFFLIVVDQISKIFAEKLLIGHTVVTIVPKIIGLTYVENTGAAFSTFTGKTSRLALFSFVRIAFLIYLLVKKKYDSKFEKYGLILIIAGGIGNLIDRFIRKYVIDFLCFLFISFPVFNIADSYITIGACIYAACVLKSELMKEK